MAKSEILKERWLTKDGEERLGRIIAAIKRGESDWKHILEGFPEVEPLENGLDLRHAPLVGLDLRGSQLAGVCFDGADLTDVKLDNADLQNAHFSRAILNSASLIKANMGGANLNAAHLKNANLTKADLSKTQLSHAKFHGADIRGTRFHHASFGRLFVSSGFGSVSANVDFTDVRYNRWTSFLGVNIANNNWAGNPLLKRHIEDQQWLDVWYNKNWFSKYALYPIWLVSCDCGRSFLLWAAWSLTMAICFGFVFSTFAETFLLSAYDGNTLADAHWFTPFYYSIVTFTTLGFGDVVPQANNWGMQLCVTFEVVLGYIMLGGLVSILATKLARRS